MALRIYSFIACAHTTMVYNQVLTLYSRQYQTQVNRLKAPKLMKKTQNHLVFVDAFIQLMILYRINKIY